MSFGEVTAPDLAAFLAAQYEAELQMFRAALGEVPAAQFAVEALGHSPAWHALHILEWLRLAVLGDRTPNYHHLGWEDRDWVQTLNREPAPLEESTGQAPILAHLDEVTRRVLDTLRGLSPADLTGMVFSPSAPTGERPRLPALGMHLRHIAYHRGQVRLTEKVAG